MDTGRRLRTNRNFFKLMFMANAEREVGRNGGAALLNSSAAP